MVVNDMDRQENRGTRGAAGVGGGEKEKGIKGNEAVLLCVSG